MEAQVPRAAFASGSERRDALSARGDKYDAMRCRKNPRDALSVRTLPFFPPEVYVLNIVDIGIFNINIA